MKIYNFYDTLGFGKIDLNYLKAADKASRNDAMSGRRAFENFLLTYLVSLFQVASQDTFGTLGAIVKRRTGNKQIGFLTNRHVAVDLDYPNQKMYHPLPPNLGPGVYLGAVERATSFITDDVWYGIYAGTNPGRAVISYVVNIGD